MTDAKRKIGALIAPCDGCGAPNGVLVYSGPNFGEYQCPRCTQNLALWGAALNHLVVLFREALLAWAEVWQGVPVAFGSVDEMIWHSALDLQEEAKELLARPVPEEVQPLCRAA